MLVNKNLKKKGIYFTISKTSAKINSYLIFHFFFLWTSFLKTSNQNLVIGKDFTFFYNGNKQYYRYTFSGSPHAQTKKGRDFGINHSKLTFGIRFNQNVNINQDIINFITMFLLKYKTLNSGLKLSLSKFY